ncbi:MAG: nucleoside kinase [bacterium]
MDTYSITVLLPEDAKENIQVKHGTTFLELALQFQDKFDCKIVGAVFNNELCELRKEIVEKGVLELITLQDKDGYLFYLRSLFFILIKAVSEIFPHAILHIEYSIGNGYYCWFEGLEWMEPGEIERIQTKMREIVKADIPFLRKRFATPDAIEEFKKHGLMDKVSLFKIRKEECTSVYTLESTIGYFSGYLVPSTSYCDNFSISFYNNGIVLVAADPANPKVVPAFKDSPKYFNIIKEHNEWLDILEMDNCAKLNDLIREGKSRDLILLSEALHEKKLAKIADEIFRRNKVIKIVSIAGPSSSGKTTTANRLSVQLKVNGLKPFLISLDDYFIDREKTPVDKNGMHDFESISAINIKLFNENLDQLLKGKEVEIPRYNFKTGKGEKSGKKLTLPDNGVLVVEGIHGLNPSLYFDISCQNIYRLYVSALTALNIDNHNRISTADSRLLRRMVRDNKYRGHSPIETIRRWDSVRKGEEKNIFPYQENADIMFNSSLVYEFSALKKYAKPLLADISKENPEFREAKRLLKFLSFFEEMDDSTIPPNSILREFIGKSVFV